MVTSRYELLLPYEFEQKIVQTPVEFLPLGTLEWHGWHLALGTDAIKAHNICLLVAGRIGDVVLPPIYFGTDHLIQAGEEKLIGMEISAKKALLGSCYYLPPDLLAMLIRQIAENLIRQGFKILVLLTGHYPPHQRIIIQKVACELIAIHKIEILALAEFELVEDLGYTGDHAGEWETSILLAIEPQMVNMTEYKKHVPLGNHLLGVDGEPEKASKEFGRWIHQAIVERLADQVHVLLKNEV